MLNLEIERTCKKSKKGRKNQLRNFKMANEPREVELPKLFRDYATLFKNIMKKSRS